MPPKEQAFTQAFEPVPMTPCAACGHDADHENELFGLVGGRWFCRECWRKGAGRSWPKRQDAKLTPVSTAGHVRRPASWKPATTNRGGK